jgi:hypothetical protein
MTNLISSVFAIDVDGEPTVIFLASRRSLAVRRGFERTQFHTADGTPLASAASELWPRIASPRDRQVGRYRAAVGGEPDALEWVYLVELDETG